VLEQPIAANIVVTVLDKLRNGLGLVPEATLERTARRWIEDLAIKAPDPPRRPHAFGGNQRASCWPSGWRRNRGCWILDSPTVGVDIAAKDGIYEVVRTLAAKGWRSCSSRTARSLHPRIACW
jgi:simple sugar transport system ATP-binding protein